MFLASFVAALALVVGAHSAVAQTTISSTFDTDADGWFIQAIDGDTGEFKSTYPLDYSSTGGNPGGFVHKADPEPNTWFFSAPSEYLGDKSQFYNGWITFDRIELSPVGTLFPRNVVGMVGAGLAIVHDVPSPGTDWTHASVRLQEDDWVIFPGDIPLTHEQFLGVLSSLQVLVIQGDTRFLHDDAAGLDNVMLIAPEPGGIVLAGLAATGFLAILKRNASGRGLRRRITRKESRP